MNALTLKETRLALDALGPWALIVGGFTVAALALTMIPKTDDPWMFSKLAAADVFGVVAGVAGVSGGFVTAWMAAVIAQGDRRHGARFLGQTLPVRPRRAVFTKCAVLAIVAAIPPIVSLACYAINQVLQGHPIQWGTDLLLLASAIFGSAACGAGLGLGVAAFVYGPSRVVAIALLVAIVVAAIGAGAQWCTFGLAVPKELVTSEGSSLDRLLELRAIDVRNSASAVAAIAGVAGAALCALFVGMKVLAQPRRRRWLWTAVVGSTVITALAGSVAGAIYVRSDSVRTDTLAFVHSAARSASDRVIIEAIRSWDLDRNPSWNMLDQALITEGIRRAREVRISAAPAEREADPIAVALRAKADFTSDSRARASLWLLSFDLEEWSRQARKIGVLEQEATEQREPD